MVIELEGEVTCINCDRDGAHSGNGFLKFIFASFCDVNETSILCSYILFHEAASTILEWKHEVKISLHFDNLIYSWKWHTVIKAKILERILLQSTETIMISTYQHLLVPPEILRKLFKAQNKI